jgi:predicted nucleotidyltransferase
MITRKLISKIQAAFSKEPKIKLAYVLGSVASGRIRNDSDFDLAVVVDNKGHIVLDDVYGLLSQISFPKDLDLSLVNSDSSPLFLYQIISTGKCVYQNSKEAKVSFEAFVLKAYYDNAHLRKIYYSYLKDKFPYANQ